MFNKDAKIVPAVVGLYQALGAAIYVSLVSILMRYFESHQPAQQGFLGIIFFLLLLVFSVAVCGSVLFGYPVYLAIHHRVKEALAVIGYSFTYSLFILIILLFILQI